MFDKFHSIHKRGGEAGREGESCMWVPMRGSGNEGDQGELCTCIPVFQNPVILSN